jgi:hypothetical protein
MQSADNCERLAHDSHSYPACCTIAVQLAAERIMLTASNAALQHITGVVYQPLQLRPRHTNPEC